MASERPIHATIGRPVPPDRSHTRRSSAKALLLAASCALTAAGPARADDAPATAPLAVSVELNTAADQGGNCRLSFLIKNEAASRIDAFSLEVVLFDAKGAAGQFLVLEAGRLPPGKARVRQYDIAGTPCSAIGRILVNDVAECSGDAATVTACADGLTTATRTQIPLDY